MTPQLWDKSRRLKAELSQPKLPPTTRQETSQETSQETHQETSQDRHQWPAIRAQMAHRPAGTLLAHVWSTVPTTSPWKPPPPKPPPRPSTSTVHASTSCPRP